MVARAALTSPSPNHNSLIALLEELQPRIRVLLELYAVPEQEAETLIHETLEALFYKWETISNHQYWMLKALEHRCQRLAGERRPKPAPEPAAE